MNLTQAYYEQRFEILFLRAKGDEFQTFFERLMSLAYKADFMACRPWGNAGDRKNDGFLKSGRCLFQVYAPNEMEAAKAIAKIKEDFEGAKLHWGTHFDKWVFAHNATDGLPPHVLTLLLDFEKANPGLTLEPWNLEEFRLIFRKLSTGDLVPWLGEAPSDETKASLGFADLRPVLETLGQRPSPRDSVVHDVPMGKIEANALSESVATLIKSGMGKAPLVERFFAQWHDETLGERIAEGFRSEYQRLRSIHTPNDIFAELQLWAGGRDRGMPDHEMAVLTVIAYYFERCDIYEAPREVHS
ncbi:MAG: ABC-three component system protein [Verrucomicrobiota bacterium]